jgi:hypothetical protein
MFKWVISIVVLLILVIGGLFVARIPYDNYLAKTEPLLLAAAKVHADVELDLPESKRLSDIAEMDALRTGWGNYAHTMIQHPDSADSIAILISEYDHISEKIKSDNDMTVISEYQENQRRLAVIATTPDLFERERARIDYKYELLGRENMRPQENQKKYLERVQAMKKPSQDLQNIRILLNNRK